jgi:hypothetical protein
MESLAAVASRVGLRPEDLWISRRGGTLVRASGADLGSNLAVLPGSGVSSRARALTVLSPIVLLELYSWLEAV